MGNKMAIGVMFGGRSVEHDVSILSAIQIIHVLKEKYDVVPIYISKSNNFYVDESLSELSTYSSGYEEKDGILQTTRGKLKRFFMIKKTDGVILTPNPLNARKGLKIALLVPIIHGQGVEDGIITSLLDFWSIPHTLPDHTQSGILQDKVLTKKLIVSTVNCVEGITVRPYEKVPELVYPVIVKPAHLGSSIGITVVKDKAELKNALDLALSYDDLVLVEKALTDFREFSCACFIGSKTHLSMIEEISTSSFFDFSIKYECGEKSSSHEVPANISDELSREIKKITLDLYNLFSLWGIVRVDYLYDKIDKKLYVNEINTVPGSLAMHLYSHEEFSDMLDELIKGSLFRYQKKNELIATFSSSVLKKSGIKNKK